MGNRVANVRVIDGKASETPVGGLVAFQYRGGSLGSVWRRVDDLPEELGVLQFLRADIDDGERDAFLPEDLGRYVRVEEIPATEEAVSA